MPLGPPIGWLSKLIVSPVGIQKRKIRSTSSAIPGSTNALKSLDSKSIVVISLSIVVAYKSLPEQFEVFNKSLKTRGRLCRFFPNHLIRNLYLLVSSIALHVPLATALRGSSATWKVRFILSLNLFAIPRRSAPPPASQIPLRMMSV